MANTENKDITVTEPVRILIADNHPIFRDGLRVLLDAEKEFAVVGTCGDAESTLEAADLLAPNILLSDMEMGLGLLKNLAASGSSARVLLLALEAQQSQVVQALVLGAWGVIEKDTTPELLLKAIRTVLMGHYWIRHDMVTQLVQALRKYAFGGRHENRKERFGLTARELQIVQAVAAGDTNKDIAKRYGISEQTVKHHLTSIYDKVGVSQRIELALVALSNNLTEVDGDSPAQGVQLQTSVV